MKVTNVVIFGDEIGVPTLIKCIPDTWNISGIVVSSDRRNAFSLVRIYENRFPFIFHPEETKGLGSFANQIKSLSPDIGIVFSYSRIIPPYIINLFRKGILNIHFGLLPEYRGTNIINWVLINNDEYTGITVHKIVDKIDAGPILLKETVKISFTDTALSLRGKLMRKTGGVLERIAHLLSKGKVSFYPQDEGKARYWRKRKPDDGYFSWEWDPLRIYNLIRALVKPWPGAFTYVNGEKVTYDEFIPYDTVIRMKNEYCGSHTST